MANECNCCQPPWKFTTDFDKRNLTSAGNPDSGDNTLITIHRDGSGVFWEKELEQTRGVAVNSDGEVWSGSNNGAVTTSKVRKYSRTGSILEEWTVSGGKIINQFTIDADDNVYSGLTPTSGGSPVNFRKFSNNGTVLWELSTSPGGQGDAPDSVIDSSGNVYIALAWEDPDRIIASKYDSSGSLILDYEEASSGLDWADGRCAAINSDGYLFVGSIEFDGSSSVRYINKFDTDASGSLIWQTTIDGNPLAVEAVSDGGVLVATSNLTAKYDKDGVLEWEDTGFPARAVVVDEFNNIYTGATGTGGAIRKLDSLGNLVDNTMSHNANLFDLAVYPGRIPLFQ